MSFFRQLLLDTIESMHIGWFRMKNIDWHGRGADGCVLFSHPLYG